MTLTKSIIELHNGRVEASSEGPGRGSEFRMWLPLLPTPEKQIGATESAKGEKLRSLRILVVDDNVDSAELLSALLGIEGHEVSVANSGPAAIDLALKDPPDVALLDIGMPGMDGYEVARRMRGLEVLRRMKLIAVSGYRQHEDIQKSREAGFDEHLVKPVDLETLGRALRQIAQTS